MRFHALGAGFYPFTMIKFQHLQVRVEPDFGLAHGVGTRERGQIAFAAN